MAGFVYIMSNPAFPNLLKIGKSKKDPTTDRVNELNQTGVPEPFKVEYYAFVEDEDYLEKAVHSKLRQQRPNLNREFFKVECLKAIEIIHELSSPRSEIKYEEVFYVSPKELENRRHKQEKAKQLERERIWQQQKMEDELQRLKASEAKKEEEQKAKEAAKLNRQNQLQSFIRIEKRKAENGRFLLKVFIFVMIVVVLSIFSS